MVADLLVRNKVKDPCCATFMKKMKLPIKGQTQENSFTNRIKQVLLWMQILAFSLLAYSV